MDFTEPFEYDGDIDVHLQNAWATLISKFEVWEEILAIYTVTITNCHGGSADFELAPIPIRACGAYTWELIVVPPCEWSRRLNGDVTPPELNLEEILAEAASKEEKSYNLYYLAAAIAILSVAVVALKKVTAPKKAKVEAKSTSSDSDTSSQEVHQDSVDEVKA